MKKHLKFHSSNHFLHKKGVLSRPNCFTKQLETSTNFFSFARLQRKTFLNHHQIVLVKYYGKFQKFIARIVCLKTCFFCKLIRSMKKQKVLLNLFFCHLICFIEKLVKFKDSKLEKLVSKK